MKQPSYTAAPIVGGPGKTSSFKDLFLGHRNREKYYEATDSEGTLRLLWMECARFGVLLAYPCALAEEGSEPLVFDSSRDGPANELNARLMERWEALSLPDRRDSLQIRELDKKEFRTLFRSFRG